MAVAHVATIKGSDNTAGTSTTTSSVTTVTGEVLFLGVVAYDTASTFTMTATWNSISMTSDKSQILNPAGAFLRVSIFSLPIATGASATAVISFSTTLEFNTWFLMRASGLATSSITDSAGGAATGVGTAVATGSFSSTASDDFWVSLTGCDSGANPATMTSTSPWVTPTNGSETNGAANMVGGIAYIANPGATSENAQWTISSSSWGVVGMAYKAAAAASGWGPLLGLQNNRLAMVD